MGSWGSGRGFALTILCFREIPQTCKRQLDLNKISFMLSIRSAFELALPLGSAVCISTARAGNLSPLIEEREAHQQALTARLMLT